MASTTDENRTAAKPILSQIADAAHQLRLLPRKLLKLATHPSVHAFIGDNRIDAIGRWIDVKVMFKQRQKRCAAQNPDPSTAEYLRTHFCEQPFRTLETSHNGLAFVCCPVWLPTPLGSLDSDPTALWTGPTAQAIRESIVDGSFRYCDHLNCSRITNRSLPPRDAPETQAIIDEYAPGKTAPFPKHLILSHDKSCNLSCPSCRTRIYVANKAKQAKLDALTDKSLLPLLREAEVVTITGSGDPFGSNHFRNLIKRLNGGEFPRLKIDLHTNGQLWDERAWKDLGLSGRVGYAQISIDATQPDTYAFARRSGTFERLLKNLAFVKRLRETGEIQELEFSMVVQTRNFREMPAFVALGHEFLADRVSFQMIRQRDIFSRDEYDEAFIGNPEHPDYAAFLDVLQSPDLASPYVHMGNVLAYVQRH
jgi:organic radical activating enzyme